MASEAHVSIERLAVWLRGDLADEGESQSIECHLRECVVCADALETLDPDQQPLMQGLLQLEFDAALVDAIQNQLSATAVSRTADVSAALPSHPSDRWEQSELLATGGIGEVWRGVDRLLNRKVAIKRLKPETAHLRHVQERFLYEARITAALPHPCTVTVFDLIEDGMYSYYVMTLVEGKTLKQLIAESESLLAEPGSKFSNSLFELLRHFVAVARTIAFAHSQGIVHRDIKSENVVVGQFGQVTVIDWGLAKRLGRADLMPPAGSLGETTDTVSKSKTLPGARMGTPAFMAPEQARGEQTAIDERTDTYGLAAMLYEILTGRPPFMADTVAEILSAVERDDVVPPHLVALGVPLPLSRICVKGLSKDPKSRYQTAEEFAADVDDWMTRESLRHHTESARQKLFELSDDLMLVFDQKPRVLWANVAWERKLGWNPDGLVGLTPNQHVHPEDIADDGDIFARLQKGETANGLERRLRSKDGSYRWFSWTATPLVDEGITCAIGRDIDARIRREIEYAAMLDSMPDAMFVLNRDQTIHLVNCHATELFGYTKEELMGQHITLLMPKRWRKKYSELGDDYMQNAEAESFDSRNLWVCDKSQNEFVVSLRIRPVQHGQTVRFIGSLRRVNR